MIKWVIHLLYTYKTQNTTIKGLWLRGNVVKYSENNWKSPPVRKLYWRFSNNRDMLQSASMTAVGLTAHKQHRTRLADLWNQLIKLTQQCPSVCLFVCLSLSPETRANDSGGAYCMGRTELCTVTSIFTIHCVNKNKNLAVANRSRVSCAHNTLRASIGINITPWP